MIHEGLRRNTRYLYSVWRNDDDRLMILDGTSFECAKVMGVTIDSFYTFCNRGGNGAWTILKKSIPDILKEMEE